MEGVCATKDKLKATHSIFDQFSQACIENYSSHSKSTANERLATYRERNPFTVYIKSKQVRYGLKVWCDNLCFEIAKHTLAWLMVKGKSIKENGWLWP